MDVVELKLAGREDILVTVPRNISLRDNEIEGVKHELSHLIPLIEKLVYCNTLRNKAPMENIETAKCRIYSLMTGELSCYAHCSLLTAHLQ